MKRKSTFLTAALVLLAFLAIPMGMRGQTRAEEVYSTCLFGGTHGTSGNYNSTWTATNGDFTWSVANGNTNNSTWNFVKFGRKNTASVGSITTDEAYDEAITKVELTIDAITASNVNSIMLYTSTDDDVWTEAGSFAKSAGLQTVALSSPATDLYYKIEFDCASGTSNGLVTVSKVEYYYTNGGNPSVVTPTITPNGGSFMDSQEVSIACATEGATIYYTTDGNDPTTSSSVYSAPFTITETTTVKAFAVKTDYDDSEIAAATFTKTTPMTVAEAIAATPTSGQSDYVYIQGVVSRFYNTSIMGDGTSYRYYISDEGENNELLVYKGNGLNNVPFSNVNDLLVGDQVVIYGKLTMYQDAPEVAAGNYIYSLVRPAVAVEAPTFSPEAGTYAEAQTVEISCETQGVDIYYTFDGTDPDDESTHYDGPITVSETTTIKAVAYDSNDQNSPIATATYHICSQANPYTVAQALAFIEYPANGIYVHGIVSTAPTMNPTSNGELTYYISDNGEATNELEVYKGKGLEQAAFTAQDDIQVGDIVTIYGNVQVYNNTIEFASGNYLVEFERPASTEPSITVANAMVSVDAEGGEGTLTVTYENFTEVIADVYFCNAEGETATYEWITAGINDDNNAEYLVEPNEGEARTAYFKVYALDDNAEEVYSNLVTINQEAYVVPVLDYAELPFEFDGGRADIATTSGLTQEGLDSDYSSSPKLKFKTTGTWVILHFNERPGTLTFDIKGNSFSGGTFTVQTSEDGVTYTDLENYTDANFGNTLHSEEFTNLGENVRYIKWIYTEKSSGNVALGNIALAEYTGPVASITVADATVSIPAEGAEGTLTVTYDNITDIIADVYFCDADGQEFTYDWMTAEINDDNNIEYLVEPNEGEARTAYFKVYALDDNAEVVYSNLVTVNQAAPVVPPTGDEYVLYTGELVEGDYVICYNNTTWTAAMKNTVESGRLSYEEVIPENDVIITDDATIVWHIAQNGEYWTIFSADANSYAAGTGVKNKAQMLEEVTDLALWSVDGTETYDFVNKGNAEAGVNAYLRNNTIYGFACYAPGTGGALSLYKKVDTQTVGQTLNLGAGYNWVSLSVEVEDPIEMLDQVKAALGDKGITIEGNGVGTENFGDGEWFGDLDYEGMYNEQMYLIQVSEDCTVELAGTPIVDPTLHVIDIYPGYNWIGFPYSEELDVNEALMGFEALDEDMIESPEGISYYFGEWMGDVMTLVPGQGYLYFSNSEDVKTMTIQTAGKSGRFVKLAKKPVKSAMIEKVTPVEAKSKL